MPWLITHEGAGHAVAVEEADPFHARMVQAIVPATYSD